MPEVTEVRKYADFIYSKLHNKNILDIVIMNGRYKKHKPFENYNFIKNKLPIKVLDVQTKGKLSWITFENDLYLLSTLGLSGGWAFLPDGKKQFDFSEVLDDFDGYIAEEELKSYLNNAKNHLNVEFKTDKGSLFFYDTLSFGTLKVIKGVEELNKKLKTIGPDIMDETTTLEIFKTQIKKKVNLDKEIGVVLMNQKIVSGVGNYLRADILYLSKVSPFRKVNKITDAEIKDIYDNARILTWGDYDKQEAIRLKIMTKTTKLPKDYDRLFFVYMEEKDILGHKVIKKELYEGSQKRFIYYVPEVQK
jgi:formamidopyrimidine-DNA glycosylase